jgi:hypothetical protein
LKSRRKKEIQDSTAQVPLAIARIANIDEESMEEEQRRQSMQVAKRLQAAGINITSSSSYRSPTRGTISMLSSIIHVDDEDRRNTTSS